MKLDEKDFTKIAVQEAATAYYLWKRKLMKKKVCVVILLRAVRLLKNNYDIDPKKMGKIFFNNSEYNKNPNTALNIVAHGMGFRTKDSDKSVESLELRVSNKPKQVYHIFIELLGDIYGGNKKKAKKQVKKYSKSLSDKFYDDCLDCGPFDESL